jgi:hypothetical protein
MNFEPVIRLERDMIKAIRELQAAGAGDFIEMRYLVDAYYQMQEYRKATANQIRSMNTSGEPHAIIDWLLKQTETMEKQVARALEAYAGVTAPGRWLMLQAGIGPVLAANFLAHLDITKTATAGGFWRFAGLDPTLKWNKGKKRPFNAKLKTACWKASDSWVKLGDREDAFYAKVYRERKALEIERNEAGKFAEKRVSLLIRQRRSCGTSRSAKTPMPTRPTRSASYRRPTSMPGRVATRSSCSSRTCIMSCTRTTTVKHHRGPT